MSCKGVIGVLSDYLNGEAGKKVCAEIEDHLRGCERCRIHIDNMKLIIKLYRTWRDDAIPDDVSIRLRSVIAEEARKKAGSRAAKQPKRSAKGKH
jgi:RNA polymerase sigma-70 factor (ECF subfamily)